jgi:hypothetical protein
MGLVVVLLGALEIVWNRFSADFEMMQNSRENGKDFLLYLFYVALDVDGVGQEYYRGGSNPQISFVSLLPCTGQNPMIDSFLFY